MYILQGRPLQPKPCDSVTLFIMFELPVNLCLSPECYSFPSCILHSLGYCVRHSRFRSPRQVLGPTWWIQYGLPLLIERSMQAKQTSASWEVEQQINTAIGSQATGFYSLMAQDKPSQDLFVPSIKHALQAYIAQTACEGTIPRSRVWSKHPLTCYSTISHSFPFAPFSASPTLSIPSPSTTSSPNAPKTL